MIAKCEECRSGIARTDTGIEGVPVHVYCDRCDGTGVIAVPDEGMDAAEFAIMALRYLRDEGGLPEWYDVTVRRMIAKMEEWRLDEILADKRRRLR